MNVNRSIPSPGVVPVLVVDDVAAEVEWLVSVLGFRERLRIPPNHRTQLVYADAALIVADRGARGPQNMLLRVDDVDAVFERAVGAGATVVSEPHSWEYGERQATIHDRAGHRWTLSQTLFDADPASWGGELVEDASAGEERLDGEEPGARGAADRGGCDASRPPPCVQ
jgi:uncharacterized glyoxalase superfamily protein PhnB